MKLELNKRYVRRDGVITGPLIGNGDATFGFTDPATGLKYTDYGTLTLLGVDPRDIVDEYPEQSDSLSTPIHSDLESRILNATKESVRLFSNINYGDYGDEKAHVDGVLSPLILALESRISNAAPTTDIVAELNARIHKLETGFWKIYAETAIQSSESPDTRKLRSIISEVRHIVRDATDPAVVEPTDEPADTLEAAHRQMQVAIDATLCYPEAMQYLNDAGITWIVRDDDRYHVTTLNDGVYTINESGFLFKQIKL